MVLDLVLVQYTCIYRLLGFWGVIHYATKIFNKQTDYLFQVAYIWERNNDV